MPFGTATRLACIVLVVIAHVGAFPLGTGEAIFESAQVKICEDTEHGSMKVLPSLG